MSTGFVIKSVVNAYDGVTVQAALDGTPQGDPVFVAGRTPDPALARLAPATLRGGVWDVSVPHPALWYVWARDAGGTTEPAACCAGLSDNPDLDLCGQKLQEILTANRPALDLALQSFFGADASVKQIVYGTAAALVKFPAILITKPTVQAEYMFMPYGRQYTYRLEIMFTLLHQDPAPMLRSAARFIGRIMEVLNQPLYEGLVLESGTPLAFCQVEEGEADETQVSENQWTAVGSCVWSGKALGQDSL